MPHKRECFQNNQLLSSPSPSFFQKYLNLALILALQLFLLHLLNELSVCNVFLLFHLLDQIGQSGQQRAVHLFLQKIKIIVISLFLTMFRELIGSIMKNSACT